jgi:hypothetical protein
MKKTSLIFLCVLLSVFCLSRVSYSESDDELLFKYGNELYKISEQTSDNILIFIEIAYQNENNIDAMGYGLLVAVSRIHTTVTWISDVIKISHMIQKKYLLNYQNQLRDRVISSLNVIKTQSNEIEKNYGSIKKVSLLHIVDKQKVINQSSLKILDKTLELLEKMILENKMKELKNKHKSK